MQWSKNEPISFKWYLLENCKQLANVNLTIWTRNLWIHVQTYNMHQIREQEPCRAFIHKYWYIDFGCMTCLIGMNLIPTIYLIKSFKCYVCMQSKQPRKSHKVVVARDLVPLELINFDLCKMNGKLTKEKVLYDVHRWLY